MKVKVMEHMVRNCAIRKQISKFITDITYFCISKILAFYIFYIENLGQSSWNTTFAMMPCDGEY